MARHAARRSDEEPRTIWKVILVMWILYIWVHSMIPGVVSSEESMIFVRLVKPLFSLIGVTDTDLIHTIVRKGAHFSEYLALAIFAVIAIRPRLQVPLWPAVLTAIVWVGVPAIDETIQRYVPGRAGTVKDVLIDMAGFFVGLLISLFVRRVVEKRRLEREESEYRARKARAARYRRKAREKAYERAGKPMPEHKPRHARTSNSQVPQKHSSATLGGKHRKHGRIQSEPEANRRRFEDRTRG